MGTHTTLLLLIAMFFALITLYEHVLKSSLSPTSHYLNRVYRPKMI